MFFKTARPVCSPLHFNLLKYLTQKPCIFKNVAFAFLAHLSRRLIGELIVYSCSAVRRRRRCGRPPFLAHLSRRLIGELIVYQWSGVRRPSVRRPSSSTMLKDLLLRNRWADQSQILCGASFDRGNDILFAASGSHDQDGRHAHIW